MPVVFMQTPDPVATGFVASVARSGGNATDLPRSSTGTSAKWLELLKEIAPRVTQTAVLRDPAIHEVIRPVSVSQSVVPSLKSGFRSDHWRLRRAPTAAVYPNGAFATAGGLISYEADSIDPHQLGAAYVDRILQGERPAGLRAQAPTRHE